MPSARTGPQNPSTTVKSGWSKSSRPVYEYWHAVPGAVVQAGPASCWKAEAVEAAATRLRRRVNLEANMVGLIEIDEGKVLIACGVKS